MLKKTVKYEDFNGNEVSENLYFHFTKVELLRMSAKYGGDLTAYINKVVSRTDPKEMIDFLEDIILSSYGQRSDDDKRFIKNAKVREDFEYSLAYAELFASLLTNPDEAQAFGKGVIAMPNDAKQVQADAVRQMVKD